MTTSTMSDGPQSTRSADAPTRLSKSEQLLTSRHRVKTYGEVFTPDHMVKYMLDLVSTDPEIEPETDPAFIDKTFFEPAAGNGNFLVAILHRKLRAIDTITWPGRRIGRRRRSVESLFALASIYGVELLEDNHQAAKDFLLARFVAFHEKHASGCGPRSDLRRSATFIINANILRGDTLKGIVGDPPLEFSWWERIPDRPGMVQRTPFSLDSLRESVRKDEPKQAQMFPDTIQPAVTRFEPCRIKHVHKEARANG